MHRRVVRAGSWLLWAAIASCQAADRPPATTDQPVAGAGGGRNGGASGGAGAGGRATPAGGAGSGGAVTAPDAGARDALEADAKTPASDAAAPDGRVRVVLDSDANNEVDDQHAIAYLLMNARSFDVEGITVNRTANGGDVDAQSAEARRVVALCDSTSEVRVYRGANGSYSSIAPHVREPTFDGAEAVRFLVERARVAGGRKLTIIAIGKLTNVALAFALDPTIVPRVRVVWLGSSWPSSGEYNLDNDTSAVNPVIDSGVDLEIAVVREGQPSGTAAVTVAAATIRDKMPGKGPTVSPITGRNGGTFRHFGDYSIDLFNHAGSAQRSLYDMAAVAVVKNPGWSQHRAVPAPMLDGNAWRDRPGNPHRITFDEDFSKDAIVADLFATMNAYVLPRDVP